MAFPIVHNTRPAGLLCLLWTDAPGQYRLASSDWHISFTRTVTDMRFFSHTASSVSIAHSLIVGIHTRRFVASPNSSEEDIDHDSLP